MRHGSISGSPTGLLSLTLVVFQLLGYHELFYLLVIAAAALQYAVVAFCVL